MTVAVQLAPGQQALEAILFDLDGTLLDSHAALKDVFGHFLDRHGIQRDRVDVNAFDGLTIPEVVAVLRADWSLVPDESSLIAAYYAAVRSAYADVSPFDGADGMLRRLRAHGIKLALVTAATSRVLVPLLERLSWSELFDAIIAGDQVPRGKPSPDGYLAALRQMKMSAAQALAVDDSQHGVTAARAAGLKVIGVAPRERAATLKAAGADTVVPSVTAIAELAQSDGARRS